MAAPAAPFSAHQAGAENWKIYRAVSWSPGFLECATPARNEEQTVPERSSCLISLGQSAILRAKNIQKLRSRFALCSFTSCDQGRRHTLEAMPCIPVPVSESLNQCTKPFFPISCQCRTTLTTSFSHLEPLGLPNLVAQASRRERCGVASRC